MKYLFRKRRHNFEQETNSSYYMPFLFIFSLLQFLLPLFPHSPIKSSIKKKKRPKVINNYTLNFLCHRYIDIMENINVSILYCFCHFFQQQIIHLPMEMNRLTRSFLLTRLAINFVTAKIINHLCNFVFAYFSSLTFSAIFLFILHFIFNIQKIELLLTVNQLQVYSSDQQLYIL